MGIDMRSVIATVIASAFAVSNAGAAEPGFFIGASGGQSTATLEEDIDVGEGIVPIDFDESETGYKAFLGYNFAPWIGIEGGYVMLGNPEDDFLIDVDSQVETELEASAWQAFLVGTIPLGNFDIFGKIGAASVNLDADVTTSGPLQPTEKYSEDESDSMMAYGAGVAYNFGHWAIRAEYEAYDVDSLDDLYFLSAGLTYRFGGDEPAPVAAPAPAPAPAPRPVAAAPAKCADGDADGVCDTADQCPQTPAGKRVGPAGCDCDFTLNLTFLFDSADLHDDDKAQLDTLASVLINPKLGFVAGEIQGHTDNVGEEAYNEGLSQRRAQAVADYLQSKGVKLSERFAAKGLGESRPVADNSTAEGRAQNRRVVIRRLDCGPG